MIVQTSKSIIGLLLNISHRSAGSMNKDGKLIRWDDAYQLTILPFEDSKVIRKFNIAPNAVENIQHQLEAVHWGALIELSFTGKLVDDVYVVLDSLYDYYESRQ